MSMFVALNRQQQLVPIDQVAPGLACACTCVECGEALVARQGSQSEHHFAHYTNTVSCQIRRETLLHLFGKQVIREAMGLEVPHRPDQLPAFGASSSWWDFEAVQKEVWMGSFRPDLVAQRRGGQRVLIEIAVTSFVDTEKLECIRAAGLWALEIDLSGLLASEETIPSEAIRQQILHQAGLKQWIDPQPMQSILWPERWPVVTEVPERPPLIEYRYIIQGLRVTARLLPSSALAVHSLAFSPHIRDLLKTMAGQLGGYYNPAYRNWVFPAAVAPQLIEWLGDSERRT